jgi:membrane protease YdiL (CAAX protease family)
MKFLSRLLVTATLTLSLPLCGLAAEPSPYQLRKDPERPRGYFFPPLFSFLLPGLDQWMEGQHQHAAIYSGVAFGGLFWAVSPLNHNLWRDWVHDRDDRFEVYNLGLEAYQVVGGLSLYHSFRSAVRSQQPQGRFTFLQKEESPKELALAPFDFSHLAHWTTYVPLGLAAGLATAVIASKDKRDLYGSEVFFSLTRSYTAGTWEEMAFRGWMLPMFYEWYGNFFWANVSSSLVFAMAHYPQVTIPWPQFLLGYHFAYTSRKRGWTLSEPIFVHAWWDVFVFIAISAAIEKGYVKAEVPVRIPLLQARF